MCYNVVMSKRLILFLELAAITVILLMLRFTNPSSAGPVGVLVFFTMIYVVMFGIAHVFVGVFMRLLGKRMGMREQVYTAIVAMGPIVLLLLQSLGSVSILTVCAVVVLVGMACFLVSKRVA